MDLTHRAQTHDTEGMATKTPGAVAFGARHPQHRDDGRPTKRNEAHGKGIYKLQTAHANGQNVARATHQNKKAQVAG